MAGPMTTLDRPHRSALLSAIGIGTPGRLAPGYAFAIDPDPSVPLPSQASTGERGSLVQGQASAVP